MMSPVQTVKDVPGSDPSKSQSYGYDAFGNLWQNGAATGVPELRPNGPAWFLGSGGQVTNQLSNTAYHAGGYQAQLSLSYGGTDATFDAEGRLVQVAFGGVVATYDFDAEGRRVKRTDVGGNATYYVYDAGGQLMAEYAGAASGSGTQYIATDQLGSTRMVQVTQGNCTTRMDYAPYGAVVPRTGQDCYGAPWTSDRMFAGASRDGATELDHMGAREYYATLGRFISPDPENAGAIPAMPGSWNMYAYAYNNPLLYIDPTGLAGICGTDPQSETGADKTGCLAEWLYERWRDSVFDRATQKVVEWASKPRDANCVARTTAVVGTVGGIAGGVLLTPTGAAAGAASGTAVAPGVGTVGLGIAGGAAGFAVGTAKGTAMGTGVGLGVGWLACSTTNGPSGGGGSGGGSGQTVRRVTNPKHHPKSASPEPRNAQQLFDKAIVDKKGVRWSKDADGTIHRFSSPSNGESHWNGSTKGLSPIRLEDIPIEIRRALR